MATMAQPVPTPRPRGRVMPKFYLIMGIVIAAVVVGGFARSYYLNHFFQTPPGMRTLTPLYHLHGLAFSLWVMLAILQPALIVSKNRKLHKKVGYAAIGVALTMLVLGNIVGIEGMHNGFQGLGDPLVFYAIPFFAIWTFAIIVLFGVLWRNHAETHKRLMLLSYTQVVEAAVARYPSETLLAFAPFSFVMSGDLIILAGMIYDWRTRGKVHRVWIVGGALVLASQIGRIMIMTTPAWHDFAATMYRLWPA